PGTTAPRKWKSSPPKIGGSAPATRSSRSSRTAWRRSADALCVGAADLHSNENPGRSRGSFFSQYDQRLRRLVEHQRLAQDRCTTPLDLDRIGAGLGNRRLGFLAVEDHRAFPSIGASRLRLHHLLADIG